MDIFGGSSQNWTDFRGHFYAFGVNVQNLDILGVVKISKIILVRLIFQLYFGGKQYRCGSKPTYEEKK